MTQNKSKRIFTDKHREKIRQSVIKYFETETKEAREKRINNLKAFWTVVRKKLNRENEDNTTSGI